MELIGVLLYGYLIGNIYCKLTDTSDKSISYHKNIDVFKLYLENL